MKDAFDKAKLTIANLEPLHFPMKDKILYLDVDASETGCSGFLYNEVPRPDGSLEKRVIRYCSHVFSSAAMKWSTTDQEAYAIIKAVASFESLLLGREFTLRTDHQNLMKILNAI